MAEGASSEPAALAPRMGQGHADPGPRSTLVPLASAFGLAALLLGTVLYANGHAYGPVVGAFAAGGAVLLLAHAVRVRDAEIRDLLNERRVLQDARRKIDTISRTKSDFIANISHEIRTPLAGVLGNTALLSETSLTDEQRACVAAIRGAAEGLMALLGDILDMSKIEAGHLSFERSAFDLRKLGEEVVAMFGFVTRDKGVVLRFTYDGDAPRFFFGDPLRIRQVLTNLVSNAVKFTADGEVRIEIRITPTGDDDARLELRVQDTGIGITPEQLPRIFDSFVQADASTTRRFGGTGLGLSICRALVRGMGGTLDVESVPGQGSTFTAALPLTVASENDLSQKMTAGAAIIPPLRIVLADDNAINRTVVLALLERGRHDVVAVDNGQAVLAAVDERPPDIIFMDCQMPLMDGYEATARLRARGYKGPIIALTANARPDDRERCLAAGMTDHLTKPIRAEDLQQILQRHAPARDPAQSQARAISPA